MTVTALRDVPTWEALADLYGKVAHDDEAARLVLDEVTRRERLEAQRRAREAQRAEWESAAHAQYLDAERVCRGVLVARDSRVTDAWQLWSGSGRWAQANCSEELRNYWLDHPRVTVTAYRQQVSNGKRLRRDERDAAQDENQGREEPVNSPGVAGAGTREARIAGYRQQVTARAQEMAGQLHQQVAVRAPAALVKTREPVDGDLLLRETRKFFRHFALWPSDAALNVATLAVAAMHAKDPEDGLPVWEYAFRLLFTGPYGSGKSWFAKLAASLAPSGKVLLEPTKPSLIDMIADRNTVVITEVDELLATPGRNRGIVAIINASYESGHYHTRKQGGKVQEVHLFGHMILDGAELGKVTRPDMRAIMSRALAIHVRTAPDGYRRPRWDKTAQAIAARGRDRLAAWMAQEVADGIGDVIPELPADLGSPRRCSLWEPLFTCALRADQFAARRDGREDDPENYWTALLGESAVQIESALGLADEDDTDSELDKIMASWEE
jgi:hypothetical protein